MKEIPCTLEDVYLYVKTEIIMEEELLLEVFALLEENDFQYFRDLFQIFDDYCKLYDNQDIKEKTIDGTAEHNFLTVYMKYRPDLGEITDELDREYVLRFDKSLKEIDFKEFINIIIFLLNSISKVKDIEFLKEIKEIYNKHESEMKRASTYHLFKNPLIVEQLHNIIGDIQGLFEKLGIKKKNELTLMTQLTFDNFVKELCTKFGYNQHSIRSGEAKIDRDIDFIDFLKILIAMAINSCDSEKIDNESLENKRVYNAFKDLVNNIIKGIKSGIFEKKK